MSNDNLIAFHPPELSTSFNDALTELVREAARQMMAQAVKAELAEFLTQYQSLKDNQGRQAVVRNGDLPERTIVSTRDFSAALAYTKSLKSPFKERFRGILIFVYKQSLALYFSAAASS